MGLFAKQIARLPKVYPAAFFRSNWIDQR